MAVGVSQLPSKNTSRRSHTVKTENSSLEGTPVTSARAVFPEESWGPGRVKERGNKTPTSGSFAVKNSRERVLAWKRWRVVGVLFCFVF